MREGKRVGREENMTGEGEDEEGVVRHGGMYRGEEIRTEGQWEELPRQSGKRSRGGKRGVREESGPEQRPARTGGRMGRPCGP